MKKQLLKKKIVGSLCEWNPEVGQPAEYRETSFKGWVEYYGCPNKATTIVGANGQWRLCNECKKLLKFKRFRKHTRIKK